MKDITIDVQYLGMNMPLSLSKQDLLDVFEGKEGILLEFVKLAVAKLKTFDDDVVKMELINLSEIINK